jgi:hypothetical protein
MVTLLRQQAFVSLSHGHILHYLEQFSCIKYIEIGKIKEVLTCNRSKHAEKSKSSKKVPFIRNDMKYTHILN